MVVGVAVVAAAAETVAAADNVEVEVVIQFLQYHLQYHFLMHYFQVHTHMEIVVLEVEEEIYHHHHHQQQQQRQEGGRCNGTCCCSAGETVEGGRGFDVGSKEGGGTAGTTPSNPAAAAGLDPTD